MKGYFIFAVLLIVTIGTDLVFGDCPSARFKGPCFAWSAETCRRVCKESGGVSGHCSFWTFMCWCEGGGC
ncbi:drosomycin-like [Diabrotica virgifera virgifera]|uniref:Drosomycin-like n=1 Tax=Diabrotica virgifera virgifera TaxID=50390 RepID=A0A6P7G2Z6_DIAVI|nr:drosomycin-like [Diabrotica virgifera virgifera]